MHRQNREGTHIVSARSLVVPCLFMAMVGWLTVLAQEGPVREPETGIELVGTPGMPPPADWYVYDAANGQQVVRVRGRWGVAPVPAGEYAVTFTPAGDGAQEVHWAEVAVEEDQVVTLALDSGIELTGRANQAPPADWYLYDAENNEQVVRARNRWGFTAVPPGSYLLTLRPADGVDQQVRWSELQVGEGEIVEVEVTSGIELVWPPHWEPLQDWYVYDADGERIVRARGSWEFAPVPPGSYTVEVPVAKITGVKEEVQVVAGALTTTDSSLGRLEIELPAARGVISEWGVEESDIELIQGDDVRHPSPPGAGSSMSVSLWAQAGPAVVRYAGATSALERNVTVVASETTDVPFDAAALAAEHGRSFFGFDPESTEGQAIAESGEVTVLDRTQESLLSFSTGPMTSTWWLTGPNPVVRVRLGGAERIVREVPVGGPTSLSVDFASLDSGATTSGFEVDVHIEAPQANAVVEDEFVTVMGRASTAGDAGATRIALFIDASASTNDDAGVDLDGDGRPDNVLAVEAAAALRLLDELERVEEESAGTAFFVAIARFSDEDRTNTVVPLTAMSDAGGVDVLRAGVHEVLESGPGGGTDYAAALDEALAAVHSDQPAGDSVILLFSDGEPENVAAGSAAAARTGLAGAVIHAFGLGSDFTGDTPSQISYPPAPDDAVGILALVTALGAPGGTVMALPRPADVLEVVQHLPILELPIADLEEVTVINATTGDASHEVRLAPDGSFEARLPVKLLPRGPHRSNTLAVTAVATDGVSRATAEVQVRARVSQEPGELIVRAAAGQTPPQLLPRVELILDASNSMWAQIEGRSRIEIAKEVIARVITDLPEDSQVALRLYGHRVHYSEAGACQDSELVLPFAVTDKSRLLNLVSGIQPRGTTPIAHALRQVASDFDGVTGEKMVLLVTDGIEECGGDPAEAVAELLEQGLDVRINIVGFDLADDAAKAEMEHIAELSGGLYFDAADASQLLDAVQQSLAVPFTVFDFEGDQVASGHVGDHGIDLPAGIYRAVMHVPGAELEVAAIVVTPGQETTVELRAGPDGLEASTIGP